MTDDKQKPIGFRWDQDRQEENHRFREALNKTDLLEKLFGDKFIEGLEKRHDAILERQRKATLLTATALLLLAIALFAVQVPISLFGVSAGNAANLREILLVLIASIPLYTLFGHIEQSRIADVMKGWIAKASGGDKEVERVLMLRYGIGAPFQMNSFNQLNPKALPKWRMIRILVMVIGGLLWLGTAIVAVLFVELWGLVSIVIQPTVSRGFSIMVVLYTAFAFCASYGMRAGHGILGQGDRQAEKQ